MSRCSVRELQFAVTKPVAEIHKGMESWNKDKYGSVCTGSSSKGLVRKACDEIRVMVTVDCHGQVVALCYTMRIG